MFERTNRVIHSLKFLLVIVSIFSQKAKNSLKKEQVKPRLSM